MIPVSKSNIFIVQQLYKDLSFFPPGSENNTLWEYKSNELSWEMPDFSGRQRPGNGAEQHNSGVRCPKTWRSCVDYLNPRLFFCEEKEGSAARRIENKPG